MSSETKIELMYVLVAAVLALALSLNVHAIVKKPIHDRYYINVA